MSSPHPSSELQPSLSAHESASGALAIVAVMSSVVAFVSVAGMTAAPTLKPPVAVPEPAQTQIWRVLATWGALMVGWAVVKLHGRVRRQAGRRERTPRIAQALAAAVLVLPVIWIPLSVLGKNLPKALLCVPPTGFALWTVHRMQRHRRMPFAIVFAGFAWGALIAIGFAGEVNGWYYRVSPSVLDPWPAHTTGVALCAGVVEELAKGAGVGVLFILCRRWLDDVVSGVVVGAAVGLGFNFTETVGRMAGEGAQVAFQFWTRQTIGLMASHLAFSALVGAGFGVARQLENSWRRRTVITCGFIIAICAHFSSNFFLIYYQFHRSSWFDVSERVQTMVLLPLVLLVLQGPFVAMYLFLLRRGLHDQSGALAVELRAEADAGTGAITSVEGTLLASPAKRFRERFDAFRRGGLGAYREVARLRAAQLELTMQRWHRSRREMDARATTEGELRERILALKASAEVST